MASPPDDAAFKPGVRRDLGPLQDGATLDADAILDHHVGADCHVRANPTVGPNLGSRVLGRGKQEHDYKTRH